MDMAKKLYSSLSGVFHRDKIKEVFIYQRVLPHYRVPFFDSLHEILGRKGISLYVIYGDGLPGEVPQTASINSAWAIYNKNYYIKILGKKLVFQKLFLKSLYGHRVVVIEQANRIISNYILIALGCFNIIKVCFWGHGRNFQSSSSGSMQEIFKKSYSRCCDWWFCYTREGCRLVGELGFDSKKITPVYNSIDTQALISERSSLSDADLADVKKILGLEGGNVGIYCGGMYKEKRVDFLLDSCRKIKMCVPDFEIIFIGSGPDQKIVEKFCFYNSWAHFVGPVVGSERVKYFCLARVMLMPGLVGLAVLDSFALGVPMVTTNISYHSPEIDYLVDGINGLITEDQLDRFVTGVVQVLNSKQLYAELVYGCKKSSKKYTVRNMADNFAEGIAACLKE